MHWRGEHVSKDYHEAARLYQQAAEQGYPDAQSNLALMYEIGQAVPKSYKTASKLHRQAADQGFGPAQYSLGVMYEKGWGVSQDNVMAHMWFNVGVANGNILSGKGRDMIAEEMTSEDLRKAHVMAAECLESGYNNCGY